MAQKRPPKFCWGCGAELKDSQKFCTKCGKPVSQKKGLAQKKQEAQSNTPKTASYQNYGAPPQKATATSFNGYSKNPRNNSTRSDQITAHPERTPMEPQVPQPRQTPAQQQPYIPPRDVPVQDNNPVLDRIDRLEQKLDGLDNSDRFEKVEYKLNALFGEMHFADQIKELSHDIKNNSSKEEITKLSESMNHRQAQLESKLDMKLANLATTDDILKIRGKLDVLDMNRLDNRLGKIEERLQSFNADEKITNLAKNTVDRLNSMEQKVDNMNIETRTRLTNIDKNVGKFEHRLESMNNALATLVPSLIKLTEKVNQLQFTAQSLNTDPSAEKGGQNTVKLDLPPFPGMKKKGAKSPTPSKDEVVATTEKDNVAEIKKMLPE